MNTNIDQRVEQLTGWYGDGTDGSAPTPDQWRQLINRPNDTPVTLINFFKLRQRAHYPQGQDEPADAGTGEDAFMRYAAVSIPTLEKVGGRFLLKGPFEATFIGDAEDWDVIAIGTYPNIEAVLALFEDNEYRKVYVHRSAACERQKVFICPV